MASVNNTNKKIKTNNHKIYNGKIDTKKVFPKKGGIKTEVIQIDDALSSRVRRNQQLYDKPQSVKKVNKNFEKQDEHDNKKLLNTKQQKFNFDDKKIKIEDDMDTSFFNNKRKNSKPIKKKPVSIKIEDIPINKALKKKNDSMVITMLFLAVVIVFMGVFIIYHFSSYDHSKKVNSKVKTVEVVPENIVFLGDSITEMYDLDKYFPNKNVVNSGISGNTTKDVLDDMRGRVYRYNPSHVFLLIGTNDYANGDIKKEETVDNIEEIINEIKKNLPKTKLYVESIYPINKSDDDKINKSILKLRDNDDIKYINKEVKKICKKKKIVYIDLYSELVNDDGDLSLDYTKEGLHISDEGYEIVTWEIKKYLKDK